MNFNLKYLYRDHLYKKKRVLPGFFFIIILKENTEAFACQAMLGNSGLQYIISKIFFVLGKRI